MALSRSDSYTFWTDVLEAYTRMAIHNPILYKQVEDFFDPELTDGAFTRKYSYRNIREAVKTFNEEFRLEISIEDQDRMQINYSIQKIARESHFPKIFAYDAALEVTDHEDICIGSLLLFDMYEPKREVDPLFPVLVADSIFDDQKGEKLSVVSLKTDNAKENEVAKAYK